ncbi:MAG: HepT-like ribonuclease domain-containing protein [Thermoanaerobaculia bacterium]
MTSRDLGLLEDMRVYANDALGIARRIGRESFLADRTMQHAVIRCLTVVGEAANRVSAETQSSLPEVAWRDAVGLRNVLVHDYQGINLPRIWTIVEEDIPPLLDALSAYLNAIE